MRRIAAAAALVIGLCAAWPAAGADKPLVVDLWPGKVPDDVGDLGAEVVRMSPKLTRKEVEVTEPTRLVTNVSKPTITVYRPAKEKDTGAAVIICPGGGYWNLYWELEGEEVAAWLTSHGVTGIILKYRVPRRPDEPKGEPARRPLQDAQRAVSLVRGRAKDWGIDPKRIGMIGFSAGGHLAVATATGFEKRTYEAADDIDKVSCRPDFAIAAYSGYLKAKDKDELASGLRVPAKTPPIFLVHGDADLISDPNNSVVMYQALRRAGVPAELHVYAGAAHDFGVRKGDRPCFTWTDRCLDWLRSQGFLEPAVAPTEALEPWASNRHPGDVSGRHTVNITAARQDYRVNHGGTMDGTNCRSPVGGSFGVWDQTWESNRAVRMENVGETDVVNPWLSNGRNDFRNLKEIVAGALRPGMTDREKALALWWLETTHRFHATTGDAEVNDPVKALNVYGYTTCGDDSICLAGLWKTAGFKVRPARVVGHCITQVNFDGRWNLLDGDMGPFFLLRDNATIAGERDLVRDHDLVKRSHTHGILDADSRAEAEWSAALFVYEGEAGGDRNSARDTTMNMVLRPHEALVWRWGHRVPLKYHGRADLADWRKRAPDRVCNGLWEYRPDFAGESWRRGADAVENVRVKDGELVAEADKVGVVVWKMRSPYVFVGGRLEIEGTAKFSVSWDGKSWQDVSQDLDTLFPREGPARYEYRLKCELPPGARLRGLAVINDLQMAPLALPGMAVGENRFTYTDQSTGPRRVRITHEWVERSDSRPPGAPPAPVFPAEGAHTDGTDIVFQWAPPRDAGGDGVADYHFELSDRADMAWPLSANFSKLVSNTADRGRPRYALPGAGLLTPGQAYYWHVRAKNGQGVWGPWGKTWSFIAGGPASPVEVSLEAPKGVLRWKPNPAGQKPVRYRVYGSDEKGFSVSDEPYRRNVGQSKDVPAQAPANFVAETSDTKLAVLGAAVKLPNANRAFYRVVAVAEKGPRSGPSDYAAAPRPFITTKPQESARVGTEYRYEAAAVRSLGDLRLRVVDGKEVAGFWDVERPRFTLAQGPAWLRIDGKTGVLRGVPDAAGMADVVVRVTLERSVRRLDEGRLSWGQELVKEVAAEKVGEATQRFRIVVGP
ncbi:MAG TPA: prolyl oligopeptidase family serine peptidase [Gemmataceae bacterium]|nr:prolyl oligopeptidase family serine peptidase [Gemmataceae bacterium]